jgi:alanyl-tRNA synthetase
MGFERITTILQQRTSTYDTDLFKPLSTRWAIANTEYGADPRRRLDENHAIMRAATFVIGDGQYPGKYKRDMRKIMRRHGSWEKTQIDANLRYRVGNLAEG